MKENEQIIEPRNSPKQEIGFNPEELLACDMAFVLNTRTLNAIQRHFGNNFPSFSSLREFCKSLPNWPLIIEARHQIGPKTTDSLRQVFNYLDWVDQTYPQGIPPRVFQTTPTAYRTKLSFVNSTGESKDLGFLPTFGYEFTHALTRSLKKKQPLITTEENHALWQEQVKFLRRYYCLEIPLVTEEDLREAQRRARERELEEEKRKSEERERREQELRKTNLEQLLNIGEAVFNQLPTSELHRGKIKTLLRELTFFDLFKPKEETLYSLTTLQRFFHLLLGLTFEAGQLTDPRIETFFRQYYFLPHTTFESIGKDYGITRSRVGQINKKTLHIIRVALRGFMPGHPAFKLPLDWYQKVGFYFPEKKAVIQTQKGEDIALLDMLKLLKRYKANLVIKESDTGDKELDLVLPEPVPTKLLEERSRSWLQTHGFLTLRGLLEEIRVKTSGRRYITLLPFLKQAGFTIYRIRGGTGYYHFINPEDKEVALAALTEWKEKNF